VCRCLVEEPDGVVPGEDNLVNGKLKSIHLSTPFM
jgi:hypothetical protein